MKITGRHRYDRADSVEQYDCVGQGLVVIAERTDNLQTQRERARKMRIRSTTDRIDFENGGGGNDEKTCETRITICQKVEKKKEQVPLLPKHSTVATKSRTVDLN